MSMLTAWLVTVGYLTLSWACTSRNDTSNVHAQSFNFVLISHWPASIIIYHHFSTPLLPPLPRCKVRHGVARCRLSSAMFQRHTGRFSGMLLEKESFRQNHGTRVLLWHVKFLFPLLFCVRSSCDILIGFCLFISVWSGQVFPGFCWMPIFKSKVTSNQIAQR